MRLNYRLIIGLMIWLLAVSLVTIFPPYSDDSGLIGGTFYASRGYVPSDQYIYFDDTVFFWEKFFLSVFLISTVAALRSKSRPLVKKIYMWGVVSEIVIFLLNYPVNKFFAGPQIMMMSLNLAACIILYLIIVFSFSKA